MANDVFTVRALQAKNGDCLLVTYGNDGARHYLLIDGGTGDTAAPLLKMLEGARDGRDTLTLEALVVTHFDTDHINGINGLLEDKPDWLDIKDVWFNGQRHLYESDLLAANQGDELTRHIRSLKLPWNKAFNEGAVKTDASNLARLNLEGGLEITFLSPGEQQLNDLRVKWPPDKAEPEEEDKDKGEKPADMLGRKDRWPPKFDQLWRQRFRNDSSVANGSSIAMILEFEGKRALMSGDAHAPVLVEALQAINRGHPVDIDLFKVSHHGSWKNTNPELMQLLDCRSFLITTNGNIHEHPDHVAIAKIIKYGGASPELIFNYRTDTTSVWEDHHNLQRWPRFTTRYPNEGENFVEVRLI